VRASVSGSRLTLTAESDTRGAEASFRLVVSDVDDADPPPSRTAAGRIQFRVIGTPSAPGEPRPYPLSDEVGTIKMGWAPPDDDGGAPVTHYVVREERSGTKQRCDTNECVFRKLKTGGNYSFRVQAVNRVGGSEWSDLSRSARADTQPGRVQDIRMAGRDDGQITIAWDKPSTNTSRILDYTITWPGGATATVPGNQTSYTAIGLDNNQRYVFTIKAQNQVGYSLPRSSVEMQPLGTPPAPAAPAVTDLEAGANQTSMRIGWSAVLPEGPGPTVYTVSYSNGVTAGTVPGCQRLASLTCTHSGVPYDGTTYTYTVVAANQPGDQPGKRSQPSAGTAIEAVGRPAAWGAFDVYPTGTSQEAEVRYTVPDSRGDVSKVDILVAGGVVRSIPQQTGTNTQRIPTPSNEQPYAVQLRVCNEDAPAGCTLSGVQNVQSFGRLDDALGTIQPIVNGKSIQWVVSGTSNGDPAVVEYEIRNRGGGGTGIQRFRPTGVGAFSFTTPAFSTENWAQEQEIFVTVSDDAPGGRGQDSGSSSVRSAPPPPPTIGISRGDRCQDGSADQPACADAIDVAAGRTCTADTCAYAVITIRFAEGTATNWSCDFDKFWPRRSKSGSGDFSGQVDAYYASGEQVVGNCTFANGLGKVVFSTPFP
jgi:hypothetical protein